MQSNKPRHAKHWRGLTSAHFRLIVYGLASMVYQHRPTGNIINSSVKFTRRSFMYFNVQGGLLGSRDVRVRSTAPKATLVTPFATHFTHTILASGHFRWQLSKISGRLFIHSRVVAQIPEPLW